MTAVIQTASLTKTYGGQTGCSGVSLNVEAGSAFALLGPNGAGKSTFVKMLVGLLGPTSGSGKIFGFPLAHAEARKRTGYLPELFRYQDWLSAAEVLVFHAFLHGAGRRELRSSAMRRRINETLHTVGLANSGGKRIRQFSKGMQQRLGMACAILMDPPLIILDEPSSALDPVGRFEMRNIIAGLRARGKTIFLNTHLLEDVETVCDEVAFLADGELKAVGRVDELLGRGETWDIAVGGFMQDAFDRLSQAGLAGVKLTCERRDREGNAVIRAQAANREQIGWLNARLTELGFTLYEVMPVRTSLEKWFLSMIEGG